MLKVQRILRGEVFADRILGADRTIEQPFADPLQVGGGLLVGATHQVLAVVRAG